ncbi:bifunctional glycosyltransferase family 2 protein/CDP-glycerol:glycerophosphate glycerophosphotransferase [Ornithinibacillus gellani]|nr:bifunctional glycosyltransferase family 2 protein/CDP-glycerol:glycerophosphate glycerophosphotransferase [Ornithinibacillus gellani]
MEKGDVTLGTKGKISVIMPVHQTERYVKQAVQSIMHQTHEILELILIDDHSSEACTEIIQSLKREDERITVHDLEKGKTVGAARNLGLKHATGDYIYFIDSDDYLPERTLAILIEHVKGQPMIHGRVKSTGFGSGMAIVLDGLFKVKQHTEKRYHLFKNRSVLNTLFRTEYIRTHGLSFREDVQHESDLAFLVPALAETISVPYVKEAVYFKRKRNDPITEPSLSQADEAEKITDFLSVYHALKDQFPDEETQHYLDTQLLNYYRKEMVMYFKVNDHIDGVYEPLRVALKRVHPDEVQGWFFKREMKAIQRHVTAYKKVSKQHHLLRDMRNGMKSRRKLYIFLYQHVFSKLSIKENVIFLESFLGKNYSCSPKYMYAYMQEHYPNYRYVWSFTEKRNIPGNAKQVKRFSLRYFYYLARAKYWISNSRLPKYLTKREGNIYVQNWHGTPLKTLVFDMEDIHSADPNYKKSFYEQSRRWDYLSSPNQYSSDIFRRAFQFEKEMLEYGYPRNDILYQQNNPTDIQAFKTKMNLPLDKKIVLYAPTWRDDEFFSRGKYKFNLQLDLELLQERLGKEYIIVLRMHYFIANQLDISGFEGFVYDFSTYDDIAELYLVSDILMTDYSSVFFDYANLKRPILFFTYDLDKYRDTLRGFYMYLEKEGPGPLLMTSEEVVQAIENIETMTSSYAANYSAFYNRFCHWDNGQATKRTVEHVFGEPK